MFKKMKKILTPHEEYAEKERVKRFKARKNNEEKLERFVNTNEMREVSVSMFSAHLR